MKQILMVGFSCILDTVQVEDQKMMKDKLIDGKKIVSRFRGKLVKMIKDVGSKYNDYSIAPKIRQILLHWGYELTETICFIDLTKKCIKMNYYWFNRKETLQKAKERYSKEIAAEYYLENKEAIKENSKNRYKNFSSKRQD